MQSLRPVLVEAEITTVGTALMLRASPARRDIMVVGIIAVTGAVAGKLRLATEG